MDFEEKLKVLNEIKLEYPNLDNALYERILRYLNYNKSEYKYNLKFILESLPSSLQNNLIIEIYKPIIMNFQFFKNFENSDFFVKIVTSLKPILSMKDDILIQEGDIIEDIIFIKKGVLSLEIILDLNNPKKSIESHLAMTGMECFKNISDQKFSTLLKINTLSLNNKPEFNMKQIVNNNYERKKEIKIIDLRQNEHFGDILMILNEKSPIAVKVKSKKAELFFLQKTEATEISNRYSNIWKRIVNRSLHNMKEIKNIIQKKIFLFIEAYNIGLNKEFKEKYLNQEKNMNNPNSKDKFIKNKTKKHIETILEEDDESILNNSQTMITEKNIEQSTQVQTQKILNTDILESKISRKNKSKISKKSRKKVNFRENEVTNENQINQKIEKDFSKRDSFKTEYKQSSLKNEVTSILKNNKKNNSSIEGKKKNLEIKSEIKEVNEVIKIVDKEFINSSQKNQINTFNINIYAPKLQFPLSKLNAENQNSSRINLKEKEETNDSFLFGKINSEISFNKDFEIDIKDNNILMNNLDENNNKKIFFNKQVNENKDNKNTNVTDDYNTNLEKLIGKRNKEKILDKVQNEKIEIKTDDKASIKSNISDKNNIKNKDPENAVIKKIYQFDNLNTSQSVSFSINSIYDNINEISKFKYQNNSDLREKTKNFILEQISEEKKPDLLPSKTIKHNNKFLDIKFNMNLNQKKPIMRKKSENFLKSTLLNKNENEKLKDLRSSSLGNGSNRFLEKDINALSSPKKIKDKENIIKTEEEKIKPSESKTSLPLIKSNKKIISPRKKPIKKHDSLGPKDKTFFNKINRMKTLRKRKENPVEEKTGKENKNAKLNYDKLISKNIEKNQKNLNNPEEYFERFFNDIIFHKNPDNSFLDEKDIKKKEFFR